MIIEPSPTNACFGCGGANSRGMRLAFEQDDATRRIRCIFRAEAEYQGGPGFVHGGIIATLLDEVMGKVNRFHNLRAVTAELSVEYLRPVPVDEDLVVEGWEVERKGRNLYHAGEIRDASSIVLARGKGRFVEIDPSRYYAENDARKQQADSPLEI
ncbi:MAG TPA: PaaI family thioesterase [Candidatus Acidoferrales bacterium]|nr:PaaI family thioesterase [Candidatus Acidoferrales bacterium]